MYLLVTLQKFNEIFCVAEHPAYSPDLASSDYYVFLKLKKIFEVRKFTSKVV
jgi:hypothetical protein